MTIKAEKINTSVGPASILEELKGANLGVFLLGGYYALEFGSLQGLYTFYNNWKIPTLLGGASIIYAVYSLVNKKISFSWPKLFFISFLFVLIVNVHFYTFDSFNRNNLTTLFVTYFSYLCIGLSSIRSIKQYILLIDIMLASMAFTCLHGALQGGIVWGNQWVSDQNIYALFCCMGLPYAYFLLFRDNLIIKKLCYLLCITLFIIGIVLAASRGGILSLAICILAFLIRSKHKVKFILILTLCFLLLTMTIGNRFNNELNNFSVDEQEGSAGERIYLWQLGLNMYKDHKIFGIGLSNYGDYFLEYDTMAEARDTLGGVNWRGWKHVAHSTQISFLAETGLIGVGLFIISLGAVYYRLYREFYRDHTIFEKDMILSLVISSIVFLVGGAFLTLTAHPFIYNNIILSIVFVELLSRKTFHA